MHPNPLTTALASLFDDATLRRLAKQTGFVVRERRLDVVALFWTLVLGPLTAQVTSPVGLQRRYHETTGTVLATSSFSERFDASLVAWLQACFAHAVENAARCPAEMADSLAALGELVAVDSTVLHLHDALATRWPGCRKQAPAAAKLNVVYNVSHGHVEAATLAPERRSEHQLMKVGAWVRGKVLLFDLGYFKLQTFWRIHAHDGLFVTRLKSGATPAITALNGTVRGRAKDLVGQRVADVLPALARQCLDCEVEYRVSRKGLPGRPTTDRRAHRLPLRVVAWRNHETGDYHTYLTNIPADFLTAEEVVLLYRARWTVELLFKQMRSLGGLEALQSQKPEVVTAGVLAALLGVVANRQLLAGLKAALRDEPRWAGRRIATMRWCRVFVAHAGRLLDVLAGPRSPTRLEIHRLTHMLLAESLEPKRRKLSLEATLCL